MMGLLSCLSPLFPRSGRSTAEDLLLEKHAAEVDSLSEKLPCSHTTGRLGQLRTLMKEEGIDVYVQPTADAHGSEYVGDCDKRRAWLSGFTGSAAVALVTSSSALLFTDSRYYVQAGKELDSNWTLQKVGMTGVKTWDKWLLDLPAGSKIGIDSTLVDHATMKALLTSLATRSLSMIFPSSNLVDKIWKNRPARSCEKIVLHPLEFSGEPASSKLANLRSYLSSASPSNASFLLTTLPSIAWFLNLRGHDIAFNPVFYSYVLVPASPDQPFVLWTQENAVSKEVRDAMEEMGGKIEAYDKVFEGVKGAGKVMCDGRISWALVEAVGEDNLTLVRSPVELAQAVKNDVEIAGFKRAYIRDGAAWVRWAAWLEETVKSGTEINEWDAAEKLTEFRRSGDFFAGLAYENISATAENAALPHYAPLATSSSIIDTLTPYLNDSGAQYLDGTIDTTRTVHFGSPTKEHKRAFTRVLQGHIAIDSLFFPQGTTGNAIDVLARRGLWAEGMD